ncbi:MAG: hypothetical protein H6659_03100 [Ardenticatenaceae bacterium]|nr:hypothetical protein [Ardenticatenaceae bacterium]MCB8986872.1 hypothetical protein [Ardenticatenaceae bacterium]
MEEEEGQDQSINYVLVFILLFAVALSCGVLSFLTLVVTGILSLTIGG